MQQATLKPIAVKIGESPTMERHLQNGGFITEIIDRDVHDTVLIRRYKAVYDCPLDALKVYRVINDDQHKAGIAFREAYHLAVRCRQAAHERISQNMPHKTLTKSDRMLREAYKILPSYEKPIIIDVCGHDESPTSQIDLFRLKEGLTKLSNYWNMTAMEICD